MSKIEIKPTRKVVANSSIKEKDEKSNKFLFFILLLSQFVFLLCFRNSIILDDYISSIIYFLFQLGIFCYIIYNKTFLRRAKFLMMVITSIGSVSYTLAYNYFLSYLYASYVDITGIRNPLFINSGFVSNSLIIWCTLLLVYLSFLFALACYIIFTYNMFKASIELNKKLFFNKENYSLILIVSLAFILMNGVKNKYKKQDSVDDVIKYFLYEYQYYDNYLGDNKYICYNLKYLAKDRKSIKVYPLFSEDKASYVIKSDDNYKFGISECKN
ncbi:hypothetical protein [Haemophilus pittmaniae]|nr:hypothetical protein [Haemophilus pittmaniae]